MSFPVSISVDASRPLGPLHAIHRFFGADEPNYAYMRDGRKLLAELGQLGPDQVYFRAHSLLVTGDGTPALKWGSTNAYTEDEHGVPIYDWSIIDRIFDNYLERGVKPYVQIGFMPKALSTHPEPYEHHWTPTSDYDEIYTGWAYPPKDYARWAELVYQWAKHCVEIYGRTEVESWYWETWNEPNIGYWRGAEQDFFALHDYAIDAVRRALPTARVGGPETAFGGTPYLRAFLEHCLLWTNAATGKTGSPLDFVSFHAKGSPEYQSDHVRMGISNHLSNIDRGFRLIASFPELKSVPIVIGESDPEGCAAAQGPQLGYRNGTMYSSYTAASFARKHDLAAKHGVNLEGALTWAFEFEDLPYFAGFRVLATNSIDLPVLNVFRMFARMGRTRVEARSSAQIPLETIIDEGVRGEPDVGVLASSNSHNVCAMIWHYHDDDLPGPEADVTLSLKELPWICGRSEITHFRIDDKRSNAFKTWQDMGSPQQPTSEQYAELEFAGQLTTVAKYTFDTENHNATVFFKLPRQGVSLIVPARVDPPTGETEWPRYLRSNIHGH